MNIRDFMDLQKMQKVQDEFSNATGLAAIAIDNDGQYLTEGSNFTDFCMKYTRGSLEGNKRCIKCDSECSGTYFCHAGLMDFSIDLMINDKKLGSIIGGQVLPKEPDEEEFRAVARELNIDPDAYIQALNKVPRSTEAKIRASADLLGLIMNQSINLEYVKAKTVGKLDELSVEIKNATDLIETINNNTHSLQSIANKQKMLSLNASIEAARSGEAGVGFAVVAKSMGDLLHNLLRFMEILITLLHRSQNQSTTYLHYLKKKDNKGAKPDNFIIKCNDQSLHFTAIVKASFT